MEQAANKKILKKQPKSSVSSEVKDYSNDPFFVKKGKASEAFLNKHGFPKELVEKR
jgi:hypothetical protein